MIGVENIGDVVIHVVELAALCFIVWVWYRKENNE